MLLAAHKRMWVKSCTAERRRYSGCRRRIQWRTVDRNVSNMLGGTDRMSGALGPVKVAKQAVRPIYTPTECQTTRRSKNITVDSPAATGCKESRNTEYRLFTKCHLMQATGDSVCVCAIMFLLYGICLS